tara:strand:- start:987 stop:1619 length:633 start_codon:yes stop_codon:yes gene_type:complete
VRIEKAYTPISEPSPWWLKGLAIFMVIMSILYALNALLSAATPILVSQLTDTEWEEIEEYPEDGTEEEKQEWEEGKIAWDDMQDYFDEMMGFIGWTAFHSGLLAIIGTFSAFLLWTNREAGIKAVGLWIAVNFIGGIWMMWRMSKIGFTPIDDYGQEAGGTMIPDLINQFSMIMGVGQIALCNGFLLALLVLVASKSKPETTIDIPSGFR